MINIVTLLGRLTKDIELSKTANGTTAGRFSLAVDKRVARGQQKQTSFIPCKVYGQTAETMSKWFKKGSEVGITGYLDAWVSESPNGSKRYGMDVIVNEFSFTSGSNKPQTASNEPVEWPEEEITVEIDNSDLPF